MSLRLQEHGAFKVVYKRYAKLFIVPFNSISGPSPLAENRPQTIQFLPPSLEIWNFVFFSCYIFGSWGVARIATHRK